MKAIFINPTEQKIIEVQINKNKVEQGLKELLNCEAIGLAGYINERNMLYVNAGIIEAERKSFSVDLPNFIYPISGNGVILGINQDMDDLNCTLDLEEIKNKNKIKFLTDEERLKMIFKK